MYGFQTLLFTEKGMKINVLKCFLVTSIPEFLRTSPHSPHVPALCRPCLSLLGRGPRSSAALDSWTCHSCGYRSCSCPLRDDRPADPVGRLHVVPSPAANSKCPLAFVQRWTPPWCGTATRCKLPCRTSLLGIRQCGFGLRASVREILWLQLCVSTENGISWWEKFSYPMMH